MPIRRRDVGEMIRQRRAHVACDGFGGEVGPVAPFEHGAAHEPGQHRRHASGKRARAEPAPAIPNGARARGRPRKHGGDARSHRRWRRKIGHVALDARAERDLLVAARGAFGAAEQVLLDRGALHRVELSVAVRRQQRRSLIAVHRRPRLMSMHRYPLSILNVHFPAVRIDCGTTACNSGDRRNKPRARARRDITVPMGMSTTRAMSR